MFDSEKLAKTDIQKTRKTFGVGQSLGAKVNSIAEVFNSHKKNEDEEASKKAKSNLEMYLARKKQAEEQQKL